MAGANYYLHITTAMSRLEWDFSHIYSPLFYSRQIEQLDLEDGKRNSETVAQMFGEIQNEYANNDNFMGSSVDLLPIPRFLSPDKNTIIFFTASNRRKFTDSKQSNFAWVKYTLTASEPLDQDEAEINPRLNEMHNKGGMSLVRYYFPSDPYKRDAIEWDKIKGQILMDGVSKMSFSFWDRQKQQFVDSTELLSEGRHLVRGLRLAISWIDLDGFEHNEVRVFRPLFPHFKAEPPTTTENEGTENPNVIESEPATDPEDPNDT
jgi:hypothetical protein